jgi:type IV pilus assembly protein PilW
MHKGFTLVEILVALAISGVLMTGIYAAYKTQQDSYLAQEQVAEMQQNIRASLDVMARELRLAGFRGDANSSATIEDAEIDAISFSMDLNEDGDTDDSGENIAYDKYDSGSTGPLTLGRSSSGSVIALTETPSGSGHFEATGHQPFASEIEEIEFYYGLEDGSETTSPGDPSEIRSIQISILTRARNPDPQYTNTETYITASGSTWDPNPDDNFRRRFQILNVKCRNMGL